jgi:hypothetical protein
MAAKPIVISSHAGFQMGRRRIKRADVVATIRKLGQILPSLKGRHVYQSRIGPGGRLLLRVIVKEDARAYHVVTV